MKVKIDIDTKTFVRFWLVVIAFALGLLALYSARTALIIIGASLFLALALSPPVKRLAALLPGNSRLGGTALAYVAVVLVLGGFVFMVVPPIVEQSAKLAQTIPASVNSATQQWGGIDELIERYGVRGQVNQALESFQESASSWASNIGATLIAGAGSLFSFLAALLIVLVMTFLMLLEGPTWMERIWKVYTDKDTMKHHKELATQMYKVVSGYVNGQLFIAFIAACASSLMTFTLSLLFDVPGNLAIPVAAIVFIGSLIPMFGATIAGVIVTILLAFNDVSAAVVFLAYFLIYQQVENNLIATVIQSKTLDLSPLVVLVSVTLGTYLMGIAGGLISIPVAGCVKVLIDDYLEEAKRKRVQNRKPLVRLAKRAKEVSDSV